MKRFTNWRGARSRARPAVAAEWFERFLAMAGRRRARRRGPARAPRPPRRQLRGAAGAIETLRRAVARRARRSGALAPDGRPPAALRATGGGRSRRCGPPSPVLPDARARAALHLRIGAVLRDLGRDPLGAAASSARAAEIDPLGDGTRVAGRAPRRGRRRAGALETIGGRRRAAYRRSRCPRWGPTSGWPASRPWSASRTTRRPRPLGAGEWPSEARLYRLEAELAESAPRKRPRCRWPRHGPRSGPAMAEAADALYEQARAQAPDAPDVLRAAARRAEGEGDFEAAPCPRGSGWRRSPRPPPRARFTPCSPPNGASGGRERCRGAARDAIPAGPARALALAESGLAAGATADVALRVRRGRHRDWGPVGAVLLEQAARFSENGRDRRPGGRAAPGGPRARSRSGADRARSASRHRPRRSRGGGRAGSPISPQASPPPRRWRGPRAGRRRGSPAGPGTRRWRGRCSADSPPSTATGRARLHRPRHRDRRAARSPSLARLRADAPTGAGAATLAWLEAESRPAKASGGPPWPSSAAPSSSPRTRSPWPSSPRRSPRRQPTTGAGDGVRSLAARDPARRADAALALAGARAALADEGSPLAARAALQTAIEAAPGSALFWTVAAADARAGRKAGRRRDARLRCRDLGGERARAGPAGRGGRPPRGQRAAAGAGRARRARGRRGLRRGCPRAARGARGRWRRRSPALGRGGGGERGSRAAGVARGAAGRAGRRGRRARPGRSGRLCGRSPSIRLRSRSRSPRTGLAAPPPRLAVAGVRAWTGVVRAGRPSTG